MPGKNAKKVDTSVSGTVLPQKKSIDHRDKSLKLAESSIFLFVHSTVWVAGLIIIKYNSSTSFATSISPA